jgi:predicted AlkP superfamily phosphohydrolase/phosphomutase
VSRARVLLVGWDGATWDAIDPLLAAGRLPTLAALLGRGFRAVLESTIPPVTPAAWTAIATGQAPGRTGVLGFRHLDLRRPSGFDPRLAGSEDLRGRTLFEHAAASGLGVALAAYPMTWPPFPIEHGVLLSGWPRPETAEAPIWPPSEAAAAAPWGHGATRPSSTRVTRDGREDPEAAATELDERTVQTALRWLRTRSDQLVFVGLQGSDHLAHRFWDRPELARCYERLDGWLAELMRAAGPGVTTMVVSDHGFGPGATGTVHLGRALVRAGLLARRAGQPPSIAGRISRAVRRGLPTEQWRALRDRLPRRLRTWGYERALDADGLDPAGTRVTRVPLYEGYEGLVVQVRGRQRGGSVDPGRWAQTREEARRAVWGIEDASGPVADAVWSREEVWEGPALPGMPDLVVALRPDLTAGERLDEGPVVERRSAPAGEGSHRRDGILAGAGPGLTRGSSGRALRVAPQHVLPTALATLGLGVPAGIDGRPCEAILSSPPPPPVPRAFHAVGDAAPRRHATTQTDDLRRSLEELGYLA